MSNKNNEKNKVNNLSQLPGNQIPPIPEVYTNAASINISPYEFEITMGLGSGNYEGVRPAINIRMSPQFAKEFGQILIENINLYQEQFGKIDVPKK